MITQIEKELNEMMAKFKKTKEENTVICDSPKLKKTYTYRKTTVIMSHDLSL